jgi:hypothetical protein
MRPASKRMSVFISRVIFLSAEGDQNRCRMPMDEIDSDQFIHQQRVAIVYILRLQSQPRKKSLHFEWVFVKLKGLAHEIFHGYTTLPDILTFGYK